MKKFFNILIKLVRGKMVSCRERLRTNLPFRMSIGKFGILLIKIGRTLQIRYANWNHEFRLQVEFDSYNSDRCTVHVSEKVTEYSILTFGGALHNIAKQTTLSRELLAMRGITEVAFRPYQISIHKGCVYGWDEILPEIEATILKHLTTKSA